MARANFIHDASKLIAVSPELPSRNPTTATWQEPPHPIISNAQSGILPQHADVVIIGSGITGIGAANYLLNASKADATPLRVVMLEARGAVSGATGRNGGHLVSDSSSLFPHLVDSIGIDQAKEVAQFSEANIRHLKQLVAQLPPRERRAVEFRDLSTSAAFPDAHDFTDAVVAARQLKDALPNTEIDYCGIGESDAGKQFWYHTAAGALQQTNVAALWPYRLLTAILSTLLEDFSDSFSLDTNTPVRAIDYDENPKYPYVVNTPRGHVRASRIIHCTNGYSASLIPGLVGKIYPLRGTMSTQQMGPSFPRLGDKISWAHIDKATYDPNTGHAYCGLYYAQQSANTGVMYLGGEAQKLSGLLSSDDSIVGEDAKISLSGAATKIWKDAAPVQLLRIWSGIMGFTGDGLPLVGRLSGRMTKRGGCNEWIAAGYNGHGMDKAWLCGEAVAAMVLGKPVEGLPKAFCISDERCASWTTTKAAETLADHIMLHDNEIECQR